MRWKLLIAKWFINPLLNIIKLNKKKAQDNKFVKREFSQDLISGTVTLNNMYKEDYDDACFFFEKVANCRDEFEKRRYLRAAAVFFVASVDSWLAQKVKMLLDDKIEKRISLDREENEILEKVSFSAEKTAKQNLEKHVPSRYKMADVIKRIVTGKTNVKYTFPNEFIEMDNYRNYFVHYGDNRYEINYKTDEIIVIINNGLSAIEKIMNDLGFPQDIPKRIKNKNE